MRHNCISTLAVFIRLALCGVPSSAEELAPVKDLPHTIGSAAKTHGPLMFCNVSDASSVARAYGAAAKRGKQPFMIGWKLGPTPPYDPPKIVLVTNQPLSNSLPKSDCLRVQPLPSGGVDTMQLGVPYAAVDKAIDWSTGYTALVWTTKNESLPAEDYVPRLKRHIKLVVQLFEPRGMDGYLILAGKDFEWAYLHWVSEEASVHAFASPEGKTGPADSASFQHRRNAAVQIFPGASAK